MNCKYIISFARVFTGFVFIISGISKALDTDHFGNILVSYGIEQLYFVAPMVIFAELLLGLALIFDFYSRYAAVASSVIVAVFTLIYTYGLIFGNITDCGCFGRMTFLNNSPTLLYMRNAVLSAALIFIAVRTDAKAADAISLPTLSTAVILLVTGAFICGNTFGRISVKLGANRKFDPIILSSHPLQKFVKTDSDSTYMVTLFSYTCPHCINSMGNLEQYESFGIVDAVIGICADSPQDEIIFKNRFKPSFRIKKYPIEQLVELSYEFPVSYIIRNDSIIGYIPGEVPSAFFFEPIKSVIIK